MSNFRLYVDKTYLNSDRLDFFRPYLKDKKVLHVGCNDWPKTRPEKNLHLHIWQECKQLDGIDPNLEGAELIQVPNGTIYHDWANVKDEYDVILVPEVIEHIGNVQSFLEHLNTYKGTMIITAPDAYVMQWAFKPVDEVRKGVPINWHEHNHIDHNYWFSPWTLYNTIQKYSRKKVKTLHWIANHSIAAVCEDPSNDA